MRPAGPAPMTTTGASMDVAVPGGAPISLLFMKACQSLGVNVRSTQATCRSTDPQSRHEGRLNAVCVPLRTRLKYVAWLTKSRSSRSSCPCTTERPLSAIRSNQHSARPTGILELIVVDDGSRDRTRAIVDQWAERDSRVRVLAQANRGVAAARNRALAAARGEFIAPLDADDLWDPTKIERQVRRMIEAGEGTGLVYCWWVSIDPDGTSSTVHRNGVSKARAPTSCCR